MANLSAYCEYNFCEILLTFKGLTISQTSYTLRIAHLHLELTMAPQLPPTESQNPPPAELALTPASLTPKSANSAVNQLTHRPSTDVRDSASPFPTTYRKPRTWISSPSHAIERAYPGESKNRSAGGITVSLFSLSACVVYTLACVDNS